LAEQAKRAHLGKYLDVSFFVSERFQHSGLQLLLTVSGGGVSHHALVFCELVVQQKWVFPIKAGFVLCWVKHSLLRAMTLILFHSETNWQSV